MATNPPLPGAPDPAAERAKALAGIGPDPQNRLAGFDDGGFANQLAALYKGLATNYSGYDLADTQAGIQKEKAWTANEKNRGLAIEHLNNMLGFRGNESSSAAIKASQDLREQYDTNGSNIGDTFNDAMTSSGLRRQQLLNDYDSSVAGLEGTLTGGASKFLSDLAAQDAATKAQQDALAAMQSAAGGGGGGGGGGPVGMPIMPGGTASFPQPQFSPVTGNQYTWADYNPYLQPPAPPQAAVARAVARPAPNKWKATAV